MALRINNNIGAINAHRFLGRNEAHLNKNLERLSSGLRINNAADDAAGLIISEQMRAQLAGIEQAINNSERAVTMVQTAEGALDEMNSLLKKANQLAIDAANEAVNSQDQLVADQEELDNIIDSITRIAETTSFGTKKLLDGSLSNAQSVDDALASVKLGGTFVEGLEANTIEKGFNTVQITQQAEYEVAALDITGAGDLITATNNNLSAMALTDEFQDGFTIKVGGTTVDVVSGTTKGQFVQQLNAIGESAGFRAVISTGAVTDGADGTATVANGQIALLRTSYGADKAINVEFAAGASGARGVSGTVANAGLNLQATIFFNTGAEGGVATTGAGQTLAVTSGNGLNIRISGTTLNFAGNLATGTVLLGAIDSTSAGATFQIGANVGQTATVSLSAATAADLGRGASSTYTALAELKGGALINGNAAEAQKVIEQAINDVTLQRGELGAFQANTLESTVNSLRVSQENLTAAESTIRDVDFAKESAEFTKNNILLQSSTAMLAQANQVPQVALQLLG